MAQKPTRGTVRCIVCQQTVVVELKDMLINDDCGVYQVSCPACPNLIEYPCNAEMQKFLMQNGVPVLSNVMWKAKMALQQDDAKIWAQLTDA